MTILGSLIFISLLGAGFLFPGWLLGRLLNTPADPGTAFLGSAALLLNLLLLLDGWNVALTSGHVAIAIAILCAVLAIATKLRRPAPAGPVDSGTAKFRWQRHHWFLIAAAIGFGAIGVKATLDPLSGYDTYFRWNFLAQQMWQEANLHFYPPITGHDFLYYGWCDGIAPLVSSLYFWAYLSLGKAATAATIPVVMGQAVLLFAAVYKLAAQRGGAASGCAALAILASSPVLLWGVAIGQETGLTALSLVAMFLFIERHRATPDAGWLVWAGLAAGTGALAREYGLAFIGLGGIALLWGRNSRRGWLQFALTAALVAFPWYVRNWLKTGNPLYNQNLGGFFPANPIQAEYSQIIQNAIGLGTPAAQPAFLAIAVAGLAGLALVIGVAGMVKSYREQIPWLAAVAGVAALWLWSINQTSGGLVYSLRVLTPAIGLAAAAGGPWVAQWLRAKGGWLVPVLLGLLAIDAAERSLFMPWAPDAAWWKQTTLVWQAHRQAGEDWVRRPHWATIVDAAESRSVLVTDPYSFTNLKKQGAHPVTIFSPTVRFLFAPDAQLGPSLDRLRVDGMRFILITDDHLLRRELPVHPFFKSLLATRPLIQTPEFLLFDLYSGGLFSAQHSESIGR